MPSLAGLDSLLILQDRDARRARLEQEIAALPAEIAAVEKKIVAERAAIEAGRGALRDLELRRKTVEQEIAATEQTVSKYKTQQLQVRKNDEYQALTHEIATAQAAVGALEEEELKLMYALDEARAQARQAEAENQKTIAGHEHRIRLLREKGENLRAELAQTVSDVAAARERVFPAYLPVYDRLAKRTAFPLCAPLLDHKCGGCHLKISSGVELEVRKADKLVSCDQCGRILYWAA